eukprot:COSAG02_NODE_3922_length_6041_cov_11.166274_5_plen_167_part_00
MVTGAWVVRANHPVTSSHGLSDFMFRHHWHEAACKEVSGSHCTPTTSMEAPLRTSAFPAGADISTSFGKKNWSIRERGRSEGQVYPPTSAPCTTSQQSDHPLSLSAAVGCPVMMCHAPGPRWVGDPGAEFISPQSSKGQPSRSSLRVSHHSISSCACLRCSSDELR